MKILPFYRSSVFLAIIACLLWSSAFASIKIGLQYTTPLHFAGIRFIISGLLIMPFCKNIKNDFIKLKTGYLKVIQISFVQTFCLYLFFYLGLNRVPAATTAIITGAGPLFVAIMAHFALKTEPISVRKIISILIGFSGILLLTFDKQAHSGSSSVFILGIAMLILSNISSSFGNILVSTNKIGISPLFLNSIQILIGGILLLAVSIPFEGFHFSTKPISYYISLAWLSTLSAIAFSLWFIVLSRKYTKVSEINIWKFIIPVFGAILSWLIVEGEKPTFISVTGMLLIALALIIIYMKKISTSMGFHKKSD